MDFVSCTCAPALLCVKANHTRSCYSQLFFGQIFILDFWTWNSLIGIFQWLYSLQVWKPGKPGWILWAVLLLYCVWQPAIIVLAIHNCCAYLDYNVLCWEEKREKKRTRAGHRKENWRRLEETRAERKNNLSLDKNVIFSLSLLCFSSALLLSFEWGRREQATLLFVRNIRVMTSRGCTHICHA